ncbi:MAG: cadherin-like domain-containing protein, partial [Pseudomonadota bacterium]
MSISIDLEGDDDLVLLSGLLGGGAGSSGFSVPSTFVDLPSGDAGGDLGNGDSGGGSVSVGSVFGLEPEAGDGGAGSGSGGGSVQGGDGTGGDGDALPSGSEPEPLVDAPEPSDEISQGGSADMSLSLESVIEPIVIAAAASDTVPAQTASEMTMSAASGDPGHAASHADHNPHAVGTALHGEHMAVFDLVAHADATHVAVSNGSWFDPATWANGEVPGADARVVIGQGVHVTYDAVSDVRLFTVRVDGHLDFATYRDTKMVLDTMVVDSAGRLTVGTADNPVADTVTADIVIANNGAIDVSWDPQLLSRGIVSHGQVEMHGSEKTVHLKVAADPMAGDTSLVLSEAPEGWQVGDTLVLAGTNYHGYRATLGYAEPEDEILTITAINGNEIFFDAPLQYDHATPRVDLKTSVANYSRNITVSTEEPETAAVHERGHVMFMHNDDVDVRYAAFEELGRTDKSVLAQDASEIETITSDANVKGRYAFHVHRAGLEDQESPAVAVGNAVWGSPGWGYVHHDSHAVFHENASYNTFGAGYVAESGNETGAWTDNIAIYAKGQSWKRPKDGNDAVNFDLGQTGDGFWFQGRMVENTGNVAASVNTGFVYFHRGGVGEGRMLEFDASVFDLPEALGHGTNIRPDDTPILSFSDNEVFAARGGIQVVKGNANQGHDVHSHLRDFAAWNVIEGAELTYTAHYVLENFDLIGKEEVPYSRAGIGLGTGGNTTDITVLNSRIEGFAEGVHFVKHFSGTVDPADVGYTLVDVEIVDAGTDYYNLDPVHDEILTGADLVPGRFEIAMDQPLVYREGASSDPEAFRVNIEGTKTDSVGTVRLPAGIDDYDAGITEVLRILQTDGYYDGTDGKKYFILEDYYSDRGTGEIHKIGHLVEIHPDVALHNYSPVYAGILDLDNVGPSGQDDSALTDAGQDVVIDLLANDSDPEGNPLAVDGVLQPDNGKVFDNGDGTVTYRPDIGFAGTDIFQYWVKDGQGGFTKQTVTITVQGDPAEPGN